MLLLLRRPSCCMKPGTSESGSSSDLQAANTQVFLSGQRGLGIIWIFLLTPVLILAHPSDSWCQFLPEKRFYKTLYYLCNRLSAPCPPPTAPWLFLCFFFFFFFNILASLILCGFKPGASSSVDALALSHPTSLDGRLVCRTHAKVCIFTQMLNTSNLPSATEAPENHEELPEGAQRSSCSYISLKFEGIKRCHIQTEEIQSSS